MKITHHIKLVLILLCLETIAFSKEPTHESNESHVFPGKVILNPEQSAHINPRYEGTVAKVYVREGDIIKKGDQLATIDRKIGMSVYHITSPISGTVLHRDLSPGEFVTNDREAFSLSNLDTVWVKFDVHPKDIKYFQDTKKVEIHSRISPKKADGKLLYISPTVIGKTRTIPVYSKLTNKSGLWLPYQLVDGIIEMTHHHNGGSHE